MTPEARGAYTEGTSTMLRSTALPVVLLLFASSNLFAMRDGIGLWAEQLYERREVERKAQKAIDRAQAIEDAKRNRIERKVALDALHSAYARVVGTAAESITYDQFTK